jgi:N-acetylmuramoyl-L-alanine amidase
VKKAPFYVLVGAHMPCILAELSFIDHEEEGNNLALDTYREDLAIALNKGISKYFATLEKNSSARK